MLIFFFNVSNFSFVFAPKRCDGKDKLRTSLRANRRGRISRGCDVFTTRRFSQIEIMMQQMGFYSPQLRKRKETARTMRVGVVPLPSFMVKQH